LCWFGPITTQKERQVAPVLLKISSERGQVSNLYLSTCSDPPRNSMPRTEASVVAVVIPGGVLSVEDVEDLYLFGFMITGFLLFGVGGYLVFREIRKLRATGGGLPVEPVYRAINAQTQTLCELSRKHDALLQMHFKYSLEYAQYMNGRLQPACQSKLVLAVSSNNLLADGNQCDSFSRYYKPSSISAFFSFDMPPKVKSSTQQQRPASHATSPPRGDSPSSPDDFAGGTSSSAFKTELLSALRVEMALIFKTELQAALIENFRN
ncbi:unnamed protein product, partial [Menidia menidia]